MSPPPSPPPATPRHPLRVWGLTTVAGSIRSFRLSLLRVGRCCEVKVVSQYVRDVRAKCNVHSVRWQQNSVRCGLVRFVSTRTLRMDFFLLLFCVSESCKPA